MKRVEELEAELGQLRTSLGAGGGKGALAGLSLFQLPTKEDVLAGERRGGEGRSEGRERREGWEGRGGWWRVG